MSMTFALLSIEEQAGNPYNNESNKQDTRVCVKRNGPLFSNSVNKAGKGIGCASTFWVARTSDVWRGKVEARLGMRGKEGEFCMKKLWKIGTCNWEGNFV